MEFEDDASGFVDAEPETVPTPADPATAAMERLKSQLAALPSQARAELAHFLIQSLDQKEEGVAAAWEAEVARRVDEIETGKVAGIPAAEVFDKLRQKYSQ